MAEGSIPDRPLGVTLGRLRDGRYRMRSFTDPELVYLVDIDENTCRREHDNARCPATYSQEVCKHVRVQRIRAKKAKGWTQGWVAD